MFPHVLLRLTHTDLNEEGKQSVNSTFVLFLRSFVSTSSLGRAKVTKEKIASLRRFASKGDLAISFCFDDSRLRQLIPSRINWSRMSRPSKDPFGLIRP